MLADLRFALRSFAKSPGFVAVAVIVAALGIGANTAIFSVVRSVILRVLPFRDPEQLVMIWEKNPQLKDFLADRSPAAMANYFHWKESAHSFSAMTAFSMDSITLTGVAKPEELHLARAAADFAETFGVRPILGRMFAPDEENVAILSHAMFLRLFGGDVKRLGTPIELNGKQYSVIGVWSPEFHMPAMWQGFDQTEHDVWLPLDVRPNRPKEVLRARLNFIYARLRPGVSLDQARAEMNVINTRIRDEDPELHAGFGVNVFTVADEDVGPATRKYILILQGAVGFVLLIACANIANLLLARSIARRKEIAVRVALGASRWRLIRQSMAESLLLSFMGGALGLLMAYWAIAGISAMAPSDTPHLRDFHLDSTALAFTFLLTILTGIIFGFAPAIDSAGRGVNEALNQGGRSGSSGISKRLRGVLVATEVALALVLLVGAGLLIRTVGAMFAADPGFRRDGLLTVRLTLQSSKYSKEEMMAAFCRDLLSKTSTLPGIVSASIANGLPMQSLSFSSYEIDGAEPRPGEAQPMADTRGVTEDYFRTMMIPVHRGRTFTRQEVDTPKSGVMVINETFARAAWPAQEAIGKAIRINGARRVVIGVVGDALQLGPDSSISPEVYFPSDRYPSVTLVVRSIAPRSSMSATLSNAIWSIDKNQPIHKIETMDESLAGFIEQQSFVMKLLGGFAALALILAAAGIYGVLAYSVSQRTREIGIRMAVGATARDILKLIVREGLGVALGGVVIGIAGAFALTRLLSGLLFGVSTTDPWTFAAGAFALVIVAALASSIPANRASKLAPLDALRDE